MHKFQYKLAVAGHTCNSSPQEAESGGSLGALGQPELRSETQSQKENNNQTQRQSSQGECPHRQQVWGQEVRQSRCSVRATRCTGWTQCPILDRTWDSRAGRPRLINTGLPPAQPEVQRSIQRREETPSGLPGNCSSVCTFLGPCASSFPELGSASC